MLVDKLKTQHVVLHRLIERAQGLDGVLMAIAPGI